MTVGRWVLSETPLSSPDHSILMIVSMQYLRAVLSVSVQYGSSLLTIRHKIRLPVFHEKGERIQMERGSWSYIDGSI